MIKYPGLPRLVKQYWLALAIFLGGTAALHFVLALPAIGGAALLRPEVYSFVTVAFLGWVVMYIGDTSQILRESETDLLSTITDELTIKVTLIFMALIAIYLNVALTIAAGTGVLLTATGAPGIGFLVALLYPIADFRLTRQWYSPASIGLIVVLSLLHAIGLLRDVTARAVLEGMHNDHGNGPTPI